MPLLTSLVDFMNSRERPGSISDLFFSFRKLAGTDDLVSSIEAGQSIIMTGFPAEPREDTLVYTTGANRIAVHRDVWITCDRKRRLFYSLDGEIWYPMKNYQRKGQVNIIYDFHMEPRYDGDRRELAIDFTWMAGMASSAWQVEMDDKEKAVLRKGISFYATDSGENTLDLSRAFLLIPGGTELEYFISFSGNLVRSDNSPGLSKIGILSDFHIYTTNDSDLKLGISRDGFTWNFNPFSFDYQMTEIFISPSPGRLEYHRNMYIEYI